MRIAHFLSDPDDMQYRDSLYLELADWHSAYSDLLKTDLLIQDGITDAADSVYNGIVASDSLVGVEADEFSIWGRSFTTEKLFPEKEGSMEGGGSARMAPASHVATATRLFYAVSPNPATDQLQVSYQKADEAEEAFILTDITGRTVEQATLAGASGTKVMDLRSLQSGMYLYRIMNGKAVKQGGKISKQ